MIQENLSFVAAPMVNQSDLPFRLLVRRYGATLAYTQMLLPEKLLQDRDYLEFHLRDLSCHNGDSELDAPVVVQLCGNDPEIVVRGGKTIQAYCDGIDLNLGCPQEAAAEGHYGGYLLAQKDWPLVGSIVSAMAHSFVVPVSAKLRLCNPTSSTVELARQLECSGASWITLHARTVSSRRRRHGAADLNQVKHLKDALNIPVISNGNVRAWSDVVENREFTGADGVMVGEALLSNPCLFASITPDPFHISREYLGICQDHPGTATIAAIRTHIRHFIELKYNRRPWYKQFRTKLNSCSSIEELEVLLAKYDKLRPNGEREPEKDQEFSGDER
ncbi:tRNA-dihydrouridine synthase [Pleurotus pulmonarius]